MLVKCMYTIPMLHGFWDFSDRIYQLTLGHIRIIIIVGGHNYIPRLKLYHAITRLIETLSCYYVGSYVIFKPDTIPMQKMECFGYKVGVLCEGKSTFQIIMHVVMNKSAQSIF